MKITRYTYTSLKSDQTLQLGKQLITVSNAQHILKKQSNGI